MGNVALKLVLDIPSSSAPPKRMADGGQCPHLPPATTLLSPTLVPPVESQGVVYKPTHRAFVMLGKSIIIRIIHLGVTSFNNVLKKIKIKN